MSTFYVLPSRSLLGQRFAEFLTSVFPGTQWQRPAWRDLAESLSADVVGDDVYVVYREDLADGIGLDESLVRDCGAVTGDEIVEVCLGGRLAALTTRRWQLGGSSRLAA
jgi:hypothetical protein